METTPKATFRSVDDYIASQPEASRDTLRCLRDTIRKALPSAQEVISYNMPTYKWHGSTLLQFAAWKGHYSLYGASGPILQAFKDDLRGYKIDKGTIRFPLDEPVPEKLIARIAKFRLQERSR